jgi:hypothetical protein
VYSPGTPAHAHDLLADRARYLLAAHDEAVVHRAAVVAVEHQEAGLPLVIPGDVAERILDIEVNVVRVIVRPAHRDDELGLALDLALLGLRIHHQKREEKQKRNDLQRLEQHHAERIKGSLARIIAEAVHPALEPGNVVTRRLNCDKWPVKLNT